MPSNIAILAVESPWWSPKSNIGQASSIPFFEGVIKYNNNDQNSTNLYHSSFFDATSLSYALDHLVQTKEQYQILWVGAHGDGNHVADAKIKKISEKISANGKKIKGLILSSCWGGENKKIQDAAGFNCDKNGSEVYGPNWILSYKHSVTWFQSAIFETAIINSAIAHYRRSPVNSKSSIINMIAEGASSFQLDAEFGYDREDKPVSLSECLTLWTRPQGASFPSDSTTELIKNIKMRKL